MSGHPPLIDTHTHIYLEQFDDDRNEVVRRAKEAGVSALLLPNIDITTTEALFQLCDSEPGFAFPMMGLHPTSVQHDYVEQLKQIEALLTARNYIAIGEIGIDLYWDQTFMKEQLIAFEEQLRWSIDCQLPVSIHTRRAFPQVFDTIYKVGPDRLKGVFHCFDGSAEELQEIMLLKHFKIGINGIVTYKNSALPEILQQAESSRIVLETDAPYLPPVPYRGKRNEPAYIVETIKKVAHIFNLTINEMSTIISQNSADIFRLPWNVTDNEQLSSDKRRYEDHLE